MTATKQFIEDAIEGGWNFKEDNGYVYPTESTKAMLEGGWVHLNMLILDPKAWQAVGKVREWEQEDGHCPNIHHSVFVGEDGKRIFCPECPSDEWPDKQMDFITELQKGKPIEEALQAISE